VGGLQQRRRLAAAQIVVCWCEICEREGHMVMSTHTAEILAAATAERISAALVRPALLVGVGRHWPVPGAAVTLGRGGDRNEQHGRLRIAFG
jgi:hypothetical protein